VRARQPRVSAFWAAFACAIAPAFSPAWSNSVSWRSDGNRCSSLKQSCQPTRWCGEQRLAIAVLVAHDARFPSHRVARCRGVGSSGSRGTGRGGRNFTSRAAAPVDAEAWVTKARRTCEAACPLRLSQGVGCLIKNETRLRFASGDGPSRTHSP